MDNFRRPKRQSKKPGNLDGFIASTTPGNPAMSKSGMKRGRGPAQPSHQHLDTFSKENGFHPAAQPKLSNNLHQASSDLEVSTIDDEINLADDAPKKTHRRPRLRTVARLASVVLILFVLLGGFMGAKTYMKMHKVLKGGTVQAAALQQNVDPIKLKGEGDGRVNILLLGIGGNGHEGPDLTDTILVASIDPVNKKAALLSVPRDLWVKMPANATYFGAYQKINATYESAKYTYLKKQDASNSNNQAVQAGFAAIDSKVEEVLGIPIHYHVLVDFQAFKQAIDTVGGVPINVPETLYDPTVAWENHNNPVIAKAGLQTFNGAQALLYSRSRETSSDFARTQRQRAVLLALKEKVLTVGTFSNPAKVSGLLDAFGNNVVTDLSISDAMRLYAIGKSISNENVLSVGMADAPNRYVTTAPVNGLSVVQPVAGQFNYSAIQDFVRNTLKDGYLANENASVTVLNGTGNASLGAKKAAELKSYGYNVTVTGDAPTKTYQKTLVIDTSKGVKKYTKHYLEQRFGVNATTTVPAGVTPGTADFVIILGNDAIPTT